MANGLADGNLTPRAEIPTDKLPRAAGLADGNLTPRAEIPTDKLPRAAGLADGNLPRAAVLYPYQRSYLKDTSRFKAGMWSRQVGKTFTTTLEAVIDVLEAEAAGRIAKWTILSVSRDRALDAMDSGVKVHLKAFQQAFEALDVPFAADELAHVVKLPGGSYIRAIASKPSTARGMSDNLILDEFAHHQDNRAVWTALFPVISKPGLKLRVISTPNGRGDKFYEIMTSPDSLFSRHVVSIHDAVADGLPRNIEELKRGISDPVAWAQEFECQFIDGASAWLPFDLIDACEASEHESGFRYQMADNGGNGFSLIPDSCRLSPVYIGMDFAARGDLTVIAVLARIGDVLWLAELIEMREMKFSEQLARLAEVFKRYRVISAALDQTGMGEMPVQEAKRMHGQSRVQGVIFTPAAKLEMATALKEAMEDRRLRLPAGNAALRADLHSVRRVAGPTGIPRLVAERDDNGHADRFWAIALAVSAASGLADGNYSYTPVPAPNRCAFPRNGAW